MLPTTCSTPDPYYQQGGDMVRVGGMGYRINVNGAAMGSRISDMTILKTGHAESIRPRTTSSPAGRRSTKARKDRRSGMW